MNKKREPKSSNNKTKRSDVIIIGAGIIGLAVAYSLSQIGKTVQIIEQLKPGLGQSTKTGGGIRLLHGSELNVRLSQISFDTWLNFERYFKIDPFYYETGHLFLSSKNKEFFSNQLEILERVQVDVDALTKSQISSRWPQLSKMDFPQGIYCKKGGYLDQHRVLRGYVETLISSGVKLEVNTRVDGLLKEKNRIIGVETTSGNFYADWIVNAAGPHAGKISALAGLQIPFVSRHHELLLLEASAAVPEEIPWLIDTDREVHMRPDGSGRALIGGFLGHDEPTDPDSHRIDLSKEWSNNVRREASKSFRITDPESKVLKGWSGLYPGTFDYMPVIDKSLPGLVTAAGFSGTGLMHAPAVGEIVSNLISPEKKSFLDISSLSSARFTSDSTVLESTGF